MNNLENPHSILLVSKPTFPTQMKLLDTDSQSLFGVVTVFREEKLSDQVMPILTLAVGSTHSIVACAPAPQLASSLFGCYSKNPDLTFLWEWIFFYFNLFLNWSIVDSQCCDNFCSAAYWLSYMYKYIYIYMCMCVCVYIYIYSFSYSFPLWFILRNWM